MCLGAGVIGDITTSAERGSLIGIFGGGELPPTSFTVYEANAVQSACWARELDQYSVES